MWPAMRTFSAAAPEGDKFVNLMCFVCFQRFHRAARRGIASPEDASQASGVQTAPRLERMNIRDDSYKQAVQLTRFRMELVNRIQRRI